MNKFSKIKLPNGEIIEIQLPNFGVENSGKFLKIDDTGSAVPSDPPISTNITYNDGILEIK